MKAVLCKAWGPPETLVVEEIAEPEPGPGEVVLAVKAVGLNFFDTLIIEGKYQYKPDLPFSPGAEVAGVVSALGRHVQGFAEGDRVMGHVFWGGCREKVVVAADRVVPLPSGIGFEAAAGLTVTYGTTIHALRDRAQMKPGETLVVLGAAGGVGQAAVEVGKVMGARVIACASSDEKLAFCRRLGSRRDRQLHPAGPEAHPQGTHRRQGGRRRLRRRRRRVYRAGAAGARLERPAAGDRLCRRRDPAHSAQPRSAERLPDRRRVLGRAYAPRTRAPPHQHGHPAQLVCVGQDHASCAPHLCAGGDAGGAAGDRPARGHRQGHRHP
jgi:hypothetical protein